MELLDNLSDFQISPFRAQAIDCRLQDRRNIESHEIDFLLKIC